jgi:GDP-4-dehydro-6-deoxy-D-mannose reductase
MSKERTALVTGASGFVGRRLCDRLRTDGWAVRGLVFPEEAKDESERQTNIGDSNDLREGIDWAGPVTHVFHLAAVTFVPTSAKSPALTMDINITATVNLLHAVHTSSPKARTIFVGSASCYGIPETLPMTEDHPLAPTEPYGISKAAADAYCRYAHQALGIDVIAARPFNHSGPGQSDAFVISSFARQVVEIENGQRDNVLRTGDLTARRDFSHVDDVIDAYVRLAENGKAGEAYNVCAGNSYSAGDVLDGLRARSNADIDVQPDPDRMRPVDIPEVVGSHDKLTRDTGWKPQRNFDTLLDDVLSYWRGALNVSG